jgi:DNA-binding NarL/FixJ family response regulator
MEKSELIKIAIVDDEALFLDGLVLILNQATNFQITVSDTNAGNFLVKLQEINKDQFPDVVLLDIQMKPINGFELVEKLKNMYPELHIIVVSSHYKHAVFQHMIKLGIAAFLPKNASKDKLIYAIQQVHKTGVYFSEHDQEMLVSLIQSNTKNRFFNLTHDLTNREIEVLKFICLEHTNSDIANKLFLSKRTVESHRQRIMEKTGVKNTVGLVMYALCNDIHSLDVTKFHA